MKKISFLTTICLAFLLSGASFALDSVFDSMDSATEVKLAPAIKPVSNSSQTNVSTTTNIQNATSNSGYSSIKDEKFNKALVNIDDGQVELRQELAATTSKYNDALNEKEKAVQNCKNIKKELNGIKKQIKNAEKSKKILNKNLDNAQ